MTAAWSCANEAQWVNDKTGPGRCAKWCGNRATCVSSIPGKPLPDYELAPFRHLTEATWKLLSCFHQGQWDPEIRRLTLPLIAYRARLHAEAKGEPLPVERSEVAEVIDAWRTSPLRSHDGRLFDAMAALAAAHGIDLAATPE